MESRSLQVFECSACAHRVYPARLRCPCCGAAEQQAVEVGQGEVLAWTTLAQPDGSHAIIATVQVRPAGPQLVARLAALPQQAGERVALQARWLRGRYLPWGAAIAEAGPD